MANPNGHLPVLTNSIPARNGQPYKCSIAERLDAVTIKQLKSIKEG